MTSLYFQSLKSSFFRQHSVDVRVYRLDLKHARYSGNKDYKLRYLNLENKTSIVSFGGAWSNHLLALSYFAKDKGLQSYALVRSQEQYITPLLKQCLDNGMQIDWLSYAEYRKRNDESFLFELAQRFPEALILPEGGVSDEALLGCKDIGLEIESLAPKEAVVVLPVGTGATMAGMCLGLKDDKQVLGVPVTPKYFEQQQFVAHRVENLRHAMFAFERCPQLGKYGQLTPALLNFIQAFERDHGIPLDPNYSAKAAFCLFQKIANRDFKKGSTIVFVHTGGLMGRLGYPEITEVS